jgi:hypothetical protein
LSGLHNLLREYEEQRFPSARRLDLQGEGPDTARQRALQWIQSRAHEQPGVELLLVVQRGRSSGIRGQSVRTAVEKLLRELEGGLLEWWQPFGPGSIAVRVSETPQMVPRALKREIDPADEGRTLETAGAAAIEPSEDIPADLLPLARRIAELRREREQLSVGLTSVVLRRVWIEAQACAMSERIDWSEALGRMLHEEAARTYEE